MPDEKGRFKKGEKKSKAFIQALAKGMEGNNNGTKLKSPDLRQEAYKQYCDHLGKGKSQESFYFEHPELTVTYKTLNKYIRENPAEFPPIKREVADIKSFAHWEDIIEQMVHGNKKPETALVQMVMRNKFGWDKENTVHHSFEPEARTLLKKWENNE